MLEIIWFHYIEDIVHMCYVITNSISYGHSMPFDWLNLVQHKKSQPVHYAFGFWPPDAATSFIAVAFGGYDQN